MSLTLPMSAIVFVDDKDKLMACHGAIVKVKRCAVISTSCTGRYWGEVGGTSNL